MTNKETPEQRAAREGGENELAGSRSAMQIRSEEHTSELQSH